MESKWNVTCFYFEEKKKKQRMTNKAYQKKLQKKYDPNGKNCKNCKIEIGKDNVKKEKKAIH